MLMHCAMSCEFSEVGFVFPRLSPRIFLLPKKTMSSRFKGSSTGIPVTDLHIGNFGHPRCILLNATPGACGGAVTTSWSRKWR